MERERERKREGRAGRGRQRKQRGLTGPEEGDRARGRRRGIRTETEARRGRGRREGQGASTAARCPRPATSGCGPGRRAERSRTALADPGTGKPGHGNQAAGFPDGAGRSCGRRAGCQPPPRACRDPFPTPRAPRRGRGAGRRHSEGDEIVMKFKNEYLARSVRTSRIGLRICDENAQMPNPRNDEILMKF